MSKIKSRYFDYINSQDYDLYLAGYTPESLQIDVPDGILVNQYQPSYIARKRLKSIPKQNDEKVHHRS